jgi:hypothetical protein
MKYPHLTKFSRIGSLCIIVTIVSLLKPVDCSAEEISLFVQQTPDIGGAVSPAAGVYRYAQNSQVNLTATPNPGYQFVYWLGDVSDPKSNKTVVLMNKSKIVMAVFELTDSALSAGSISGGGGGGAGLVTTMVDIGNGAPINTSTGGSKPVYHDQKPVVPEPATGLLLGLGSLFIFTHGRKRLLRYC